MGHTGQAGREQSQGKSSYTSLFHPLGKESSARGPKYASAWELEQPLPNLLAQTGAGGASSTSCHQQGLQEGTQGRNSGAGSWSEEQRTSKDTKGWLQTRTCRWNNIAKCHREPSLQPYTDWFQIKCRLLRNLIPTADCAPSSCRDLVEEEEGDAGNHQSSSLPPCSHNPFQNCHGAVGHKCWFFFHISATAHPALHAVLAYEEVCTGCCVASAQVSAVHLRGGILDEAIHHSLGKKTTGWGRSWAKGPPSHAGEQGVSVCFFRGLWDQWLKPRIQGHPEDYYPCNLGQTSSMFL